MHMWLVENSSSHMIWMGKYWEHLNSKELPSEYFSHSKNIFDEWIFRVSSICLNEDESLVAGCSTSLVVVFDTSSSIILQTIHVPCLSISLIGSYIITGDAEGTIGKWEGWQCGIINLEFKFVGNLKIKMHLWMPQNGPFLVKVFYQRL